MRGKQLLKILEVINENINYELGDLHDHIIGFFTAGYGASLSKMKFETNKVCRKRILSSIKQEQINKLRRELHRLKKNGLLKNNKLTERGLGKLNKLRKRLNIATYYKKERENNPIIVIFDIPEKLSGKRKWLRRALRYLDYQMIQKSVWLGENKLPIEFVKDIYEYELSSYIKIFTVLKKGTL